MLSYIIAIIVIVLIGLIYWYKDVVIPTLTLDNLKNIGPNTLTAITNFGSGAASTIKNIKLEDVAKVGEDIKTGVIAVKDKTVEIATSDAVKNTLEDIKTGAIAVKDKTIEVASSEETKSVLGSIKDGIVGGLNTVVTVGGDIITSIIPSGSASAQASPPVPQCYEHCTQCHNTPCKCAHCNCARCRGMQCDCGKCGSRRVLVDLSQEIDLEIDDQGTYLDFEPSEVNIIGPSPDSQWLLANA